MKKTLIALLLVVALVITVSVFAASASETETTPKQLWSNLTVAADGQTATGYCPHCCADPSESVTWKLYTPASGHSYLSTGGHYFLNADVTNNGAIFLNGNNVEVIIHLNGCTYDRIGGSSNGTGVIRTTGTNVKFSLVDSQAGKGQLKGSFGWSIQMESGSGNQVNIYSGNLVSTPNATHNGGIGGAVRVKKGTFNMHGGAIIDGYNTYGGAIAVDSGTTANLNGGIISGTSAQYGGAIYAAAGAKVNLYGGTISGTSAERGGAIYATGNAAKVVVDGATINNCYATNRAGAIMITGSGTTASLDVKSGTISNCYVTGGNLFGGNIYMEYTKATVSGGIIENGGVPVAGATVAAAAGQLGGNFCLRGNGAGLTVTGDAIIRNGKAASGGNVYAEVGQVVIEGGTISGGNATTGGSIYLGANQSLTMTGGEITGGNATGNGGNIYTAGNNTITINAAEGKTVKITNGKAVQGGNMRLHTTNATITGPDVTISGGSGTGPDIRVLGAKNATTGAVTLSTLNLTDISMTGKGTHGTTISVAPYGHVTLAGDTDLDRIQVEAEGSAVAADAQILIKAGYTGTTFVGWSHAATAEAVTAGATTHSSLWQEAGYTGTGEVYAIDSSTSGKILIDAGDAEGTDNKFVVAGFAGGKVDTEGNLVLTPIADLTTASAYDFVRPYFNDPITLVDDLTLDLNNSTLHVNTNGHKLSMIEMRTDTFADAGDATEGYAKGGYITVDNAANLNTVVRVEATGNQYITVPVGQTEDGLTKYAAHRVMVDIDSVNIKPASASLYYTTNMDTNPTASQFACSYGVVLSLVAMPDADFTAGENGEVYTRHDFAEFTDGDRVEVKGANSALLTGILAQDAPEGRNKAWGEELVYANAYICFEINGVEHYVMADKTYALSLLDILTIVDETDPSNASVLKMYETWKDPMEAWALEGHLAKIKAAYDEANS